MTADTPRVTVNRPLGRAFEPVWWLLVAGLSGYLVSQSALSSYVLRGVTAMAAAGVLLWNAGGDDAMKASRRLFATGLIVGAATRVATVAVGAAGGQPTAHGGLPQWTELSYVPFVVLALVKLPSLSGGRLRATANGAIAASSLWYLVLAFVEPRGLDPANTARTVGLLLVPIFVLAVLVSVLPRSTVEIRGFVIRLVPALSLIVAADIAFFVASWTSGHRPDSWVAGLYQMGLVLVLAAATTRTPHSSVTPAADLDLHQRSWASLAATEVAFPFAPVVAAVLVGAWEFAHGRTYSHAEMLPIMLIGTSILARHIVSVHEHSGLVRSLAARERFARAQVSIDALTGLANRPCLVTRIDEMLGDPSRHPVAVAVLDLNDFKDINDTHGHDTGDRLLVHCAATLRDHLPGAVIARLGGDEFAVAQGNSGHGGSDLARAIASAFDTPVLLDRRQFTVRPSIGIVLDERSSHRAGDGEALHLLAHADVAMYQAKQSKNSMPSPCVILTGPERERAAGLIRIREEISHPVLSQFHVTYQPIVHLATGAISGVEALLRWEHPDVGPVSPAHFIPLAEQVGSVGVLGDFVLRTAMADLATWLRTAPHHQDLLLGVNISPRQMVDDTLPGRIVSMLQDQGLSPHHLVLEITEGALMHDLDLSARRVHELQGRGISLAIDDYGTGYSSLRYLRRFPAETVKIDLEFVQGLVGNPRTAALMESVVQMAAALDLRTVAEGIETKAQLHACQNLGVHRGQGFLFSRPVGADALGGLLATNHHYHVVTEPVGPTGTVPAPLPARVRAERADDVRAGAAS